MANYFVGTLLVDSTDLSNYGVLVADLGGLFNVGERRGDNYTLPGLDGQLYTEKKLAAFPVSIGMLIIGKNPSTGAMESTPANRAARAISNLNALITATKSNTAGTVTLTRRLPTVGGGTSDSTCLAECRGGIQSSFEQSDVIRVAIEFMNLDGKWT